MYRIFTGPYLARILKLPVIFEKVLIQNGLQWSKNGLKGYEMVQNGHFLPAKTGGYLSKWQAWRVLAEAYHVFSLTIKA